MGINSEYIHLVAREKNKDNLPEGGSVLEFGAQDICILPEMVADVFKTHNLSLVEDISTAAGLYQALSLGAYTPIDASGEYGALNYDLNQSLSEIYDFNEKFDLVTNLGTSEHCFNQMAFFQNMHDHCKNGGLMIHAVPMAGNVNHGLYHYSPRFFAELAAANGYEVIQLCFTVDYKPELHNYSLAEYKKYDGHDLLFYAILQKKKDAPFTTPFDGMFSEISQLDSYKNTLNAPLTTEFTPYLKTGNWANIHGQKHKMRQFAKRVHNKLKKLAG